MANRWIVDASPLILLANAGQEQLFTLLADEIRVPRAVAREVRAGPQNDRARQLVRRHYWQLTSTPTPTSAMLAWDLGAGETAVLAYAAAHEGWTAILDDGAARRCAKAFGIPVKRTLGIVLLAKQHQLIPSAKALLLLLRNNGFRIDDLLLNAALVAIGED